MNGKSLAAALLSELAGFLCPSAEAANSMEQQVRLPGRQDVCLARHAGDVARAEQPLHGLAHQEHPRGRARDVGAHGSGIESGRLRELSRVDLDRHPAALRLLRLRLRRLWHGHLGRVLRHERGPVSTTTRVVEYTKGTLVVDIWDAATKELVWRGEVTDSLPDSNVEKNAEDGRQSHRQARCAGTQAVGQRARTARGRLISCRSAPPA